MRYLYCVAADGRRSSCWSVWDQGRRSLRTLRGENKLIGTSQTYQGIHPDYDARIDPFIGNTTIKKEQTDPPTTTTGALKFF